MTSRALVCFVGMDGSGKSTIIDLYKRHLTDRGYSIESYWWLEGEKNVFRDLGKAIIKNRHTRSDGLPRIHKTTILMNRKPLLSKLYINAVVAESLLFGIRIMYLRNFLKKDRVILLDRYYYDTIFALSKEFDLPEKWINRCLGFFQFLLPSPDIIVYITIPFETAYLRKPEEFASLEGAKEKSDEYQRFREMIDTHYPGDFREFDNSNSSFEPLEVLFRNLDEKCTLL